MPNALALATSPYLRQHAGNPVDWLPWGEKAFARAREEDKPIFLSIGYSTCHWCHVMARESFENEAIAALLNRHFVAIKVDREERPDVDRMYMAYLQARTGQGGWPLSAWLAPDLKPFYAGTYFPPADRDGRPGLPSVLGAIARGWREDRARFISESEQATSLLRSSSSGAAEGGSPTAAARDGEPPVVPATLAQAAGTAFERALEYYANLFDGRAGGFGGAPKFPRPANLSFLLRCAALQGPASDAGREAASMVAETLRAMAAGGIHDHVGGGFHRYSVDAEWFVPHFEKMLYDQAQIAAVALGAWQATGDERHAWLARDVLDYALRDLVSPEGGFYAAEDADSDLADGGHAEGAFYVWTLSEIEGLLGPDSAFFAAHFGIAAGGNVPPERDPQGEFSGRNILAQMRPLSETAGRFGLGPEAASDRLVACLERMRAARARRPRPHLDDKVITAWNGLMISALARASALPAASLAERQPAYREAAIRTASLLEGRFFDRTGGSVQRSACGGVFSGEGFAEDYAFLTGGLLDLYEATFDVRWLAWAEELQQAMDARFWDSDRGGYFNSPVGAADIVVRLKEDYDGAEPAASSVAALNLLRLSGLLGDDALRERGRKAVVAFRGVWEQTPHAMPQMLCALEPALAPPRHIVLTGDPGTAGFAALRAVIDEHLGPRRTVVALDAPGARAWFSARAPWLREMGLPGGRPAAYLCEEFACRAPVASPAELRSALR